MLIILALIYLFIVWIIYFKLELFPFNRTHKILASVVGVILISWIFFTVSIMAPYSSSLIIMGQVNPIAPRISGQVIEIYVKPGDYVEEGGSLFKLNDHDYKIAVEQAEENLNAAKAAYNKAKKQEEIALNLQNADPESISELQLSNAKETANQFESQYKATKKSLEKARNDLSKTIVYAPSNGYVPYVPFENKSQVTAYTPLLSFISLEQLYPVASYPQNALSYVQPGNAVEFLLDTYPGKIFTGKVQRIVWAAGEAQVLQGQTIPQVNAYTPPKSFLVTINIDEPDEIMKIHYSTKGQGVIYTDHWKPFHIINKVRLRIQSWLNYLVL